MVRQELIDKARLSGEQIDTGGYNITTTINKADQEAAVAAVQALPEGYPPNLRVAMVSIDASRIVRLLKLTAPGNHIEDRKSVV